MYEEPPVWLSSHLLSFMLCVQRERERVDGYRGQRDLYLSGIKYTQEFLISNFTIYHCRGNSNYHVGPTDSKPFNVRLDCNGRCDGISEEEERAFLDVRTITRRILLLLIHPNETGICTCNIKVHTHSSRHTYQFLPPFSHLLSCRRVSTLATK